MITQAEISFIEKMMNEPLAFILGCIIVLNYAVMFAKSHLMPLITHKKKKTWEQWAAEEAELRSERQKQIDEKFDEAALEQREFRQIVEKQFEKFDNDLNLMSDAIAEQEDYLDDVSDGTLENQLFNPAYPPFRRLKALRRLLGRGRNGQVKITGLTVALENKNDWLNVQDLTMKMKIVDEEYYRKAMANINRRIHEIDHEGTNEQTNENNIS